MSHADLVVPNAVARLHAEQERIAAAVARTAGDSWTAALVATARDRLLDLGHFPEYAAELEWTPREVVGHLRDSARIFTERIQAVLAHDCPSLADFDTTAPGRLRDYQVTPLPQLVVQLRDAQAQLVHSVANVPPTALQRPAVHEVDGPLLLVDMIDFLPLHQRDHAEQYDALVQSHTGA